MGLSVVPDAFRKKKSAGVLHCIMDTLRVLIRYVDFDDAAH